MSEQHKHQEVIGATLSVLACLALSGWFGWHIGSVTSANSGTLETRVVDMQEIQNVWDAVRITKVAVGDQQIQTGISGARGEVKQGTSFQADEDWLKNMTISLTNRTDKPIVCAQLRLWFPDTGNGTTAQPMANYAITVGRRPKSSLYHADGSKIPPDPAKKVLLLAPGETLVIHVGDYIDSIRPTIENLGNTPFSHVTRLNIEPTDFYFSDGMRWVGHAYYLPDPHHPGKYTKLGDTFFPGNAARTRTLR